ncbi:MAG TPA: hypothetical protein VFA86_06465 [Gammaproteobacteria bacterium]|nr:hypothetical protein [Gammaproteobacteria bacterium]
MLEARSDNSVIFHVCRIDALKTREERRRALAEVPEHLRDLVAYTLKDLRWRNRVGRENRERIRERTG